jgi:hypothetical protein
MLFVVAALLVVAWALATVSGYPMAGFADLLVVFAFVLALLGVLSRRRVM